MGVRAFFEPIRTLGFAGISGAYATVGSPAENKVRAFCISNNTQGDMYFTVNSAEDQMFLAAGSFRLYDLSANKNHSEMELTLAVGTQFYVKQLTAPVSGDVYIELIY
jgi:hypothetical protein